MEVRSDLVRGGYPLHHWNPRKWRLPYSVYQRKVLACCTLLQLVEKDQIGIHGLLFRAMNVTATLE